MTYNENSNSTISNPTVATTTTPYTSLLVNDIKIQCQGFTIAHVEGSFIANFDHNKLFDCIGKTYSAVEGERKIFHTVSTSVNIGVKQKYIYNI